MKKLILAIILLVIIISLLLWGNHHITGTRSQVTPPDETASAGSDNGTNSGHPNLPLIDPDADDDEAVDDGKAIYLTFDDGPSSVSGEILDILKEYKVKATFFMLEPHMKKYPEMLKRMVKEGHGVGMHGVTHDKNKFYHSEQTALDEMIKGQSALESITGVKTELIRTPYGSIPYLLDSYRKVLNEQGFKLWDWNVDSSDWALSSHKYINVTIKQIKHIEQSGTTPIVLLHDQAVTAQYLHELLDYLKANAIRRKKIRQDTKPYSFTCYDRCRHVKE